MPKIVDPILSERFKTRLKAVMKARGIRQIELADKLGVTKQQLYYWQQGRIPSREVVKQLSGIFQVSEDFWSVETSLEIAERVPKWEDQFEDRLDDFRGYFLSQESVGGLTSPRGENQEKAVEIYREILDLIRKIRESHD